MQVHLHSFVLKLIQTDTLDLKTIKMIILDPETKKDLFECLLKNYSVYETLLQIKNEMDCDHEGRR